MKLQLIHVIIFSLFVHVRNSDDKPPQINMLLDSSACGFQVPDRLVTFGEITNLDEFPWMALLGYKSDYSDGVEFKCGGTLINNRYVLTAAHCLKVNRRARVTLDIVRLGEWKISSEIDCDDDRLFNSCAGPVIDVKIQRQISHLNYSRKTGNNDIALLRLEKTISYSDFVRPICLPKLNASVPDVDTVLLVSGWGVIENGSLSDYKRKAELPMVPVNDCIEKLKPMAEARMITENQLCAGGRKGRDACKGDSGGPLMGMWSENQLYQEGIISWGTGCGREGIPGVYTRVAKYMDWIMENLL